MNSYAIYTPQERKVAYFSMEVGLRPEIPTYSGGLGILAGDTLKSFADLSVPAVGVTLLYTKGYFHQEIDAEGNQIEVPVEWNPADFLTLLTDKVTVDIEGRTVMIQAWVYPVEGIAGHTVPVLFLDTNIDTNAPEDREISAYLYGGDERYRLKQEIVLGFGGAHMLQILDHDNLEAYHMNEGHAALLTLDLMDRYQQDLETVKELCVFTTHTPVPAGHDTFDIKMVQKVLGNRFQFENLNHSNIKEIHQASRQLNNEIKIAYITNYDMYRARFLVSGVDVWLNTPLRPMEASGTSGMKAAANGVINFSVLDGWWIEGHIDGVTGWSVGPRFLKAPDSSEESDAVDAEDLYNKLEQRILPCFYKDRLHWMDMMAYNIALNGSFFNTHRMVAQYVLEAYFQ